MNDSRFSQFYSRTFPQVDTCAEMEVMNGSFMTCHSCQANRSQPPTVHILQKCPSACGQARHEPACDRAQRELGMRPTCGWNRRELDTWPPPQRQTRTTKKGAHGSFESRAPPTCAFSCCSHTRQNQQARSSRTTATNPTTRADAMLQSRLKPMWPTEPQSRSAPGPALAGPAGPRSASL